MIEWGKSGQCGDLAPGNGAEFRELSQEGGGGNGSDAVVSGESVELGLDEGIVFDLFGEFNFQGIDLFLDGKEEGFHGALCRRILKVFAMIGELGARGDQELAQGAEFREDAPGWDQALPYALEPWRRHNQPARGHRLRQSLRAGPGRVQTLGPCGG